VGQHVRAAPQQSTPGRWHSKKPADTLREVLRLLGSLMGAAVLRETLGLMCGDIVLAILGIWPADLRLCCTSQAYWLFQLI
jgi:hypothetical protein